MARQRGSNRITLDARTFLRGLSSSNEVQDGGMSPDSTGIQLFNVPGLVHAGASFASEYLAGIQSQGWLAFADWYAATSPGVGRGLSANAGGDGYFYTINDLNGQPTQKASDTGHTYGPFHSDLARLGSNFFSTSSTCVGKSNSDFTTNDFSWWTATLGNPALNSSYPHPMCVFGGKLYIADGNYLHSWDGTTSYTQVLDLPSDTIITSIAPYNNQIYIAACHFTETNPVYYRSSRIFTWDGFSPSYIDEYVINHYITVLYPEDGVLYMMVNGYFGYFNGSSFVPLRATSSSVRRSQITSIRGRIFFAQDNTVICYGAPVVGKQRIFSCPMKYGSSDITGIRGFFNLSMVASSSNNAIYCSNINGKGASNSVLYSDKIPLGSYGILRHIEIETEALASGDQIVLSYYNSKGEEKAINTFSYASHGAKTFIGFDILDGEPTYIVKSALAITGNVGIRRVFIYYDPSDRPASRS